MIVKCQIDGTERNLPDFLIVGAAKSGTTSLHHYLSRHPDVVVPATKETLFFHQVTNPNNGQLRFLPNAVTDFDKYTQLFDHARTGQVCGESCPSYLIYHQRTIENIQRYHPNWKELKIIIILREPVDKIVSHYLFVKNTLSQLDPSLANESLIASLWKERGRSHLPETLVDVLYIENTSYYEQVKAYLDVFPKVKIYLYDDLCGNETALFADLCRYLGIREDVAETCCAEKKFNVRIEKRSPWGPLGHLFVNFAKTKSGSRLLQSLSARKRNRLKDFFEPPEDIGWISRTLLKEMFRAEVSRLGRLIGRDLSCWGYRCHRRHQTTVPRAIKSIAREELVPIARKAA